MIATLLDPNLFACPLIEEGEDAFDGFVESILFLFDLQRANWTKTMFSAETCEALSLADRYPISPTISASLDEFHRTDIQVKDMMSVINWVLQSGDTVEAFYEIDSILMDDVEIAPEAICSPRPREIKSCLESLLGTSFLGESIKNRFSAIALVGRGTDPDGPDGGFRATVHDIDPASSLTTPIRVNGVFRFGVCRRSVVESLSCAEVWRLSQTETDYEFALDAAVEQHLHLHGGKQNSWSFGLEFLSSARKHNFLSDLSKIRTLLRSCAETICEASLASTHALREGSGPTSRQRARGPDKAWRRDICYEYHLHYWHGPSGIELASVVVHNDFGIPS